MKTYDSARPQGQPCWFDHSSKDVERVATFYEELFGWSYDKSGPEFGHYHMARVDGRAAAGLGQMSDDMDYPTSWTVYVAADDVDRMAEHAQRLGGKVMTGPMEVPGQGRMAIVQDPAGAVFGLWEPIGHKGFGVVETHGAMGWCEVYAPDADAVKGFYAELLGADTQRLEDSPSPYFLLKHDDRNIAGIMEMNEAWEGVPPHWMPYFQVDDADATAAKAKEAGGQVPVEPFDTPYGRLAVLNDPAGAVFSIVAPTPQG